MVVRDPKVNALTRAISAFVAITQFLPFVILAFAFRALLRIAIKICVGFDYDLVPGLDCSTLTKPMRTHDSLLNLLMEMDGKITLSQLKTRLERTLVGARNPDGSLKHPKLRMTYEWFLGFRIMSYKRHKFDIDRHFAYVTDRDGKPCVCHSDGDLEDVLEKIGNGPVFPDGQDDIPPWKFYVLYRRKPSFLEQESPPENGRKRNGETGGENGEVTTCFILRIDHVIIDGGSLGLTLMPTLLDFDDPSDDPTVIFQNMKPFTRWQRALIDVSGFLLIPLIIFRVFLAWARGPDKNALHQRLGKRAGRYFLAPKSLALSKFVDIRKATDVKINTIMSACLFRAIFKLSQEIPSSTYECQKIQWAHPSSSKYQHRYDGTEERDGLWMDVPKQGETKHSKRSGPSPWTCSLMIPSGLWIPGDQLELKNKTAAMASLVTECEVGVVDPVEALKAVQRALEESSRMSLAWGTGILMSVCFNTLPGFIMDMIASLPTQATTAVFSNVKGSEKVQKCFGRDVKQMLAYISMWENLDVGFVAGSYRNKMTFGLAGRKGSFDSRSQLRRLLQYFEEEVDDLHKVAVAVKKVE